MATSVLDVLAMRKGPPEETGRPVFRSAVPLVATECRPSLIRRAAVLNGAFCPYIWSIPSP